MKIERWTFHEVLFVSPGMGGVVCVCEGFIIRFIFRISTHKLALIIVNVKWKKQRLKMTMDRKLNESQNHVQWNSIRFRFYLYNVHARTMRVSVFMYMKCVLCAIDKSTKYIHLFVWFRICWIQATGTPPFSILFKEQLLCKTRLPRTFDSIVRVRYSFFPYTLVNVCYKSHGSFSLMIGMFYSNILWIVQRATATTVVTMPIGERKM